MESLGEKLKEIRNEKGFTIDHVSRETNISVRFLEALEAENFSVFPGEPYLIGFLKNYSSFLDLDGDKILSLYRALRIQEQPVPVEQLLKPPPRIPGFLLPVLIALVLLGAGGWGIYYLITNRPVNPVQNTPTARLPAEFRMEGHAMERRFYINDSVLITIGIETYRLELFNLSETVTIRTPGGIEILDLSQEVIIDLNNDGIPELGIRVMDFEKNNPDIGASLHFFLLDTAALMGTEAVPNVPPALSTSNTITTIIPSSPNPYPFTLQVNFQGFCMFRWEILNERDRSGTNQRYFQQGQSLDIQAQNGIRLWASNATAARFQVIGGGRTFPVEAGASGEVVVADIRWVRDEDGRFRVVFIRLEA